MSVIIYGITRIIPQRKLNASTIAARQLFLSECAFAYEALWRSSYPRGDLKIHLSIESKETPKADITMRRPATFAPLA